MEENQEQNKNKFFMYLLIVFFAAFVGSGIFLLMNSSSPRVQSENQSVAKTSTVQQEKMIIPTAMPTKGSLKLMTDTLEVPMEKNLVLNIIADSSGENISAFDVLLTYDPLAFEFVETVSLNNNFQAYSYKKDNRLTLTVVKTSQDLTPSIFKEEPVIKLTFKPKKIGQYSFGILSFYNRETTKFVNEKTEVINPEVGGIDLVVK